MFGEASTSAAALARAYSPEAGLLVDSISVGNSCFVSKLEMRSLFIQTGARLFSGRKNRQRPAGYVT